MNTLTPNEITLAFNRICANHPCENCPIKNYRISSGQDNFSSCYVIFSHAVLTGKLDLDCKPVAVFKTETTTPPTCSKTEQVPAKPVLPKWCKAGQWVIERDGKLWVIKEIQGSIVTVQTYPGAPCSMSSIPAEGDLRPVRFREYTFEEAKELLSKTIFYTTKYDEGTGFGGNTYAEIITEVKQSNDTLTVFINGTTVKGYKECGATIDGHPFGVPEVDTEAEKEAQK